MCHSGKQKDQTWKCINTNLPEESRIKTFGVSRALEDFSSVCCLSDDVYNNCSHMYCSWARMNSSQNSLSKKWFMPSSWKYAINIYVRVVLWWEIYCWVHLHLSQWQIRAWPIRCMINVWTPMGVHQNLYSPSEPSECPLKNYSIISFLLSPFAWSELNMFASVFSQAL